MVQFTTSEQIYAGPTPFAGVGPVQLLVLGQYHNVNWVITVFYYNMPCIFFVIKINILILFALVIQRGMTGMIFLCCIQRGMVFEADASNGVYF